MMPITPVVKQLLIINIIFFIGIQIPNIHAYELFSLYFPENINFKIWQPLTSMFMHANVMHIFFNMFALYSFGSILERFWGETKFLFFYISCGFGAGLLHAGVNYLEINYLLNSVSELNLSKQDIYVLLNTDLKNVFDENNKMIASTVQTILERVNCNQEQFNEIAKANAINQTPAVGASGAIYGLMTAFAFVNPNAALGLMFIPIPIKAKYFVSGLLVIDLILGFKGSSIFGAQSTGIAHFAHLGGAITGFIMMWYWKKNQFNKNRWN